MDNDDWDLFSIVRSCKATTFATPTTNFETPPPTLTTTTNNIISPQNTTPPCFDDFSFTKENNSAPITPLKPNDFIELDKLIISFNPTTTIPTPTITSIPTITTTPTTTPTPSSTTIPSHITTNTITNTSFTTPPCFDDFSFTKENNSAPITPLKPNDFIELDKLIISFNPTTTIPTPTITSIPTITTTPTTTPTPSSTTIPSHITTNTITNTSFHDSNQNSIFSNFPTLIEQQQLQLNEFTELEKMVLKFYPNTTIPTSTITAHTPTTTIFTTPTTTIPTTTFATLTTTTPIIPTITTTTTNTSVCKTNQYLTILVETQQNQPNRNNEVYVSEPHARSEIATNSFDCAFNHPSIPQQPLRKRNQLPFLLPRTNSRFLPNTHSKKPKFKSRKRKNNNQVTFVCHVREDEPSEDSWAWKKYGEKPIKGSPHPRSYYKCRSFWDCSAKKLVEKSKTCENTYVVTYKGEHNHKKPAVNQNSVVGTSRNKSSKTRLCIGKEAGSCANVRNLESPNMAMLPLDQPESNEAQVLTDTSMEFLGSSDDDVILIPNMTPMLEDLLMDLNQINSGALFP